MIRVATDFSGLGSPEEALKRLKVEHKVVFACDKDKYAKASYLANHSPEIFYDDITLRDQSKAPESDLYCFGFPCQAFSLAGNRKGFEDTMGTLFFNSLEYISKNRPECFIAENVKGLLSHDKGKTFSVIRDSLGITVNGQHNLYKYDDCVNYHIYYKILNTKKFGVPQNRERVFIIGFRDTTSFNFPKEFPLKLRLIDMIEPVVDEKYFLSQTALDYLIKDTTKGWSDRLSMLNKDTNAVVGCITANHSKGVPYNMIEISEKENNSVLLRWQNKKDGVVLDEICPTLRSSGGTDIRKRPYVIVKENTAKGYAKAYEGDSINFSNPNSETRRGRVGNQIAQTLDTACNQAILLPLFGTESNSQGARVYDSSGLSVTQSANGGGVGAKTGLYLIGKRIRRLTPLEVFRLMGYSDEFYQVCKALNSDTQLYKQGGNSIVVDTIMHLLIEVCKALKIPFTYPESR